MKGEEETMLLKTGIKLGDLVFMDWTLQEGGNTDFDWFAKLYYTENQCWNSKDNGLALVINENDFSDIFSHP